MNKLPTFPKEVHRYVRTAFARANRSIGEKIANAPNSPEESLDLSLIETLSKYSSPRIVCPGWAVRIDVHFLGGLRHYRNWEIADIGVLLFAKSGTNVVSQKVAVLQSKRLFPNTHGIAEESLADYHIGFGRLLPSSPQVPTLARSYKYDFDLNSKYKAMTVGSDQYKAIEQYQSESEVPVHYLMYNTWEIPVSYTVPIHGNVTLGSNANGGARVVSAKKLHNKLSGKKDNYQPSFEDLKQIESNSKASLYGYRLEHFIADRLMNCKDGYLFESSNEESIFNLFNRRSGPISAAFSVTIEQIDPDMR